MIYTDEELFEILESIDDVKYHQKALSVFSEILKTHSLAEVIKRYEHSPFVSFIGALPIFSFLLSDIIKESGDMLEKFKD